VLDLSARLSGPFATMILADLGAEVVKVEPPLRGEQSRTIEPLINGHSAYFISVNRGKHSVAIDFRPAQGRELLMKLVDASDVFVENFVPGTLAKYSLDFEPVAARNQRIIYASISGFGQTGPDRGLPAFDIITQAMSGLLSITGAPDGIPARVGISIGDLSAGVYAAVGILAALVERQSSGVGQHLDISMLETQVALMENAFTRFFASGEQPRPLGSRHPLVTPFQAFPTADGYVVVALRSEAQWGPFCEVLEIPEVATEARFATNGLRTSNHGELEPILSAAIARRPTAEWIALLRARHIPSAPVQTILDVVAMPQLADRGMWVKAEQTGVGDWTFVNSPIKLSRTPAGVQGPAPLVGDSTRLVLESLCGCDSEELQDLADRGIITLGDEPMA